MDKIDVSVIIVNYNSNQLIKNAINSIIEKTFGISYEIIVVDNNSSESCRTVLNEMNSDKIISVFLNENIGFGRANNEGLKIARGRNILFLNPDTILINNAITILSETLDNNIGIGACGGNLYDSLKNPTRSFKRCFPSLSWLLGQLFLLGFYEKLLYGRNSNFNNTNKALDVAYIVGADLMVKRSVLDKIGAFNPSFFMWYEEVELCNRIKTHNLLIKSIPHSHIQHLEGKTTKNMEWKANTMYKSAMSYYNIVYGEKYAFTVKIILFFLSIQRIMLFAVLKKKVNLQFWKIHLKNIINGN